MSSIFAKRSSSATRVCSSCHLTTVINFLKDIHSLWSFVCRLFFLAEKLKVMSLKIPCYRANNMYIYFLCSFDLFIATKCDTISPKWHWLDLVDPPGTRRSLCFKSLFRPRLAGMCTRLRECASNPLGEPKSNPHHCGVPWCEMQWDHWPNSELNRHLHPTGRRRQSKEMWEPLTVGRKRAFIYAPACSQGAERKSERSTTQSAKWSAALLPETKGISEGRKMVYPLLQTQGTESFRLSKFDFATERLYMSPSQRSLQSVPNFIPSKTLGLL